MEIDEYLPWGWPPGVISPSCHRKPKWAKTPAPIDAKVVSRVAVATLFTAGWSSSTSAPRRQRPREDGDKAPGLRYEEDTWQAVPAGTYLDDGSIAYLDQQEDTDLASRERRAGNEAVSSSRGATGKSEASTRRVGAAIPS